MTPSDIGKVSHFHRITQHRRGSFIGGKVIDSETVQDKMVASLVSKKVTKSHLTSRRHVIQKTHNRSLFFYLFYDVYFTVDL